MVSFYQRKAERRAKTGFLFNEVEKTGEWCVLMPNIVHMIINELFSVFCLFCQRKLFCVSGAAEHKAKAQQKGVKGGRPPLEPFVISGAALASY